MGRCTPSDRYRGRTMLLSVMLWAAFGVGGRHVDAQEPAPPPPPDQKEPGTGPQPVPTEAARTEEAETATTDLRREAIQDGIKQIQAATDLPDTAKTELLGLYQQVLEQLTAAESWTAKTEEFRAGRERAPEAMTEVKGRVDQLAARVATPVVPEVVPEDTLETLAQKLAAREEDLRTARDEVKTLDEEAENRTARRAAIPELLADANRRLEEIEKDRNAAPAPNTSPQVALARRTLLLAQKRAVEQEIKEYEEELRFFEARSGVLSAKREEARLKDTVAQATVTAWQEAVNQRREAEIERQRQQAEEELRRAPFLILSLVEQNAELTREWSTVDQRIKALQEQSKAVAELTQKVTRELGDFQKKEREDPDALADVVGPEMRRKRADIIQLRRYERDLRSLQTESVRAERDAWAIDEELLVLADIDARVTEELRSIVESTPQADAARLEPRLRELYTARRETLRQMQADYRVYTDDVRELRASQAKLLAKVDRFQAFIDRHILWLRSTEPLYRIHLPDEWWAPGVHIVGIGRSLLTDVRARPPVYAVAALLAVALLATRRTHIAALHEISLRVSRPLSDSYGLTLRAAAYTLLLSLPWPGVVLFTAWRIGSSVDVTDAALYEFAQAMARGLATAALVMGSLVLLRHVCRPEGLADAHFPWDASAARRLRANLRWLTTVAFPLVIIVYVTEHHTESVWRASLGRAAFIVGMIVLSVFFYRLLHPERGVLAGRPQRPQSGGTLDVRYVWLWASVSAPIVLAIASAAGYHYTAVRLSEDLARTGWLVAALLLLHAVLVRWLLVAQRKMAIEEARQRRAAGSEAAKTPDRAATDDSSAADVKLDIATIGEQTRRLLRSVVVFGLAIGLWVIWSDMLPALGFLKDVELWPYTVTPAEAGAAVAAGGEAGSAAVGAIMPHVQYITLADLGLAVVLAIVTVILAGNIPGLMEIAILQRLPLDKGGRYAIRTLSRYTIIVVGTVVAFGSIGIGWSKVQWLVAAMTVGLAFGLQEIFANFISGIILLFERPIRIGDTVTVGDFNGTVTRIRIRATTITDWDRKELIIPNKEFVTGQVVNWTLSDSTLRMILPVGIAYGSDVELVERTLLRIAKAHPNVLDQPEPYAFFTGFGDSSLSFELRVYVASVDHMLKTQHELNKTIDAEFRKAGIEIAFPQRDIRVRSIQGVLAMAEKQESGHREKGVRRAASGTEADEPMPDARR